MKLSALSVLLLLLAASAYADDAQADSLVRSNVVLFMTALQTGDGTTAAGMFSSTALDQVELMLNTIKESLDRDPDGTLRRLTGAGYTITLEEAEDWRPEEYLAQTLSLPMISARYTPYTMNVNSVDISGRNAEVQLTFITAGGAEIPQQAMLVQEDDLWMISNFMGITAFP